jgi:hypothetical protein
MSKRPTTQTKAQKVALAIVKRRYSQQSPFKRNLFKTPKIIPGNYAPTRKGYGSIARTRGAAVTGEMKYFDCFLEAEPMITTAGSWIDTMMDPDATVNGIGDPSVATPLCLFAPKPSAALNGRIGRQVCVYKLKINFCIFVKGIITTAIDPRIIRVLVAMDKQTNSAQMNGHQLINDVDLAFHSIPNILAFQNPDYFGRFKILHDNFINLDDPNQVLLVDSVDGLVNGKHIVWKFVHKFKTPLMVHFNNTSGGTVADIVDNSFHVLAAKSFLNNQEYSPTLYYYSRVSYKECS